jgi:hypothetical protein
MCKNPRAWPDLSAFLNKQLAGAIKNASYPDKHVITNYYPTISTKTSLSTNITIASHPNSLSNNNAATDQFGTETEGT